MRTLLQQPRFTEQWNGHIEHTTRQQSGNDNPPGTHSRKCQADKPENKINRMLSIDLLSIARKIFQTLTTKLYFKHLSA